PSFVHAWLVSLTTRENLAFSKSAIAMRQSASVVGRALSTLHHISGNFTYLFMSLSFPHCAPAPRSDSTSPGYRDDRPCTDRDGGAPWHRRRAQSRRAPHGTPLSLPPAPWQPRRRSCQLWRK